MRIVLDTNSVFSALLWRGATNQLLTSLRDHSTAQLVTSPALLEEFFAVLACALAAKAQFIVSGDQDLLALGAFQGISILTTAQALARIAERPALTQDF